MKKLRKIVSLLLAVVMMMSLCVVQVGATSANATGSGSITVSNATDDDTYYVFRMLDVSYDGSNYTYTATEDWVSFFYNNSSVANYVTVTKVGDIYYVTWKDGVTTDTTTVQEFGQLALTYAINLGTSKATASTTASNSTASFSGLDLGYYLVTTLDSGSLVELDTTNTSMTVVDKNAKPTITKSVYNTTSSIYTSSNTAGYSDTVGYWGCYPSYHQEENERRRQVKKF